MGEGLAWNLEHSCNKHFFDPQVANRVVRLFDEAWARFAHMADQCNAETIGLAKASVAYVVLINAAAHGTENTENLKAVVFGWLQKRTTVKPSEGLPTLAPLPPIPTISL